MDKLVCLLFISIDLYIKKLTNKISAMIAQFRHNAVSPKNIKI